MSQSKNQAAEAAKVADASDVPAADVPNNAADTAGQSKDDAAPAPAEGVGPQFTAEELKAKGLDPAPYGYGAE